MLVESQITITVFATWRCLCWRMAKRDSSAFYGRSPFLGGLSLAVRISWLVFPSLGPEPSFWWRLRMRAGGDYSGSFCHVCLWTCVHGGFACWREWCNLYKLDSARDGVFHHESSWLSGGYELVKRLWTHFMLTASRIDIELRDEVQVTFGKKT